MYLLYNKVTILNYIDLSEGELCTIKLSFDQIATNNLKPNNKGVIGHNANNQLSNQCYISCMFIGE